MSVLDRSALEASPLADLHTIASELSIDGYRRLRRAELISTILERQSGGEASGSDEPTDEEDRPARDGEEPGAGGRRRRSRRGGRGRGGREDEAADTSRTEREDEAGDASRAEARDPSRAEREDEGGATGGGSDREAGEAGTGDGQVVEGVVELLAGGSGFVRVDPPEPSDEDVYISSAQVKRCELVSGDRISGPKRAPRRSERFASLIRIETINGRPAAELADSVRFDELPAAFPDERLKLGSDDPTLKAIEFLTPFGKGSRVTITGAARAGKSFVLRELARALAGGEDVAVSVVLAGARPEEIAEWAQEPHPPVASASLGASTEVQDGTVEPVIDQARRLAARGADAVVLIDSLDGCTPQLARKALGSARNVVGGGSVTVIATASAPLGGETTVIALDARLAGAGRFPALDLTASGTLRPESLVGPAGAEALLRARAEAAD